MPKKTCEEIAQELNDTAFQFEKRAHKVYLNDDKRSDSLLDHEAPKEVNVCIIII